MANKLVSTFRKFFFSSKVITFLGCILVASFLWLINSLNRMYIRNVTVPVKYINLPKNKMLANDLPTTLNAEIKATGAKLLFLWLKKDLNEVEIDFEKIKKGKNADYFAINSSTTIGSFSKVLNTEVELIKLKPDSIYFNFGKSHQKVVTVSPQVNMNFEPLYNLADNIKITPSIITISGDSLSIKKIDTILTEKIVFNNLNQNTSQEARLIIPEELANKVVVNPESVTINLTVDKMTEASFEVNVECNDAPNNTLVKTFPNKVSIKYQIPMSLYETTDLSKIKASVSYKDVNDKTSKLKVTLSNVPSYIKLLKTSPEKVEYILKKQ